MTTIDLETEREHLIAYYAAQPGRYKIMPRDIAAIGLGYQASIYEPVGAMHYLIADVHTLDMAECIVAAMNAADEVPR